MSVDDPKWSIADLAARWGYSLGQVKRLVYHPDPAKRIPFVRIGGRVRFEPSEIEAWLAARRERPQDAPREKAPTVDDWKDVPGASRYTS